MTKHKEPTVTITDKASEECTRTVYTVLFGDKTNPATYYLIDIAGQDGNIIDTYVRDIYGHSVEDPEVVHTITDYLDEYSAGSGN